MNTDHYKLFGFANGGGSSPQFLEPVFKNENKDGLFIQACNNSAEPDSISEFVLFLENVEVIENDNGEALRPGQKRLFAIRDIGDTIVCGDRNTLKKHLIINIGIYIDKPYFFKDACQFSNYKRPELALLSTNKNLLESSVLIHSIRRFCSYEHERQSVDLIKNLIVKKSDYEKLYFHKYESNKEKSIFSRWVDFVQEDSPKLARDSEWRFLNEFYNTALNNEMHLAKNNTSQFYLVAKKIINDQNVTAKISEGVNEINVTSIVEKFTKRHFSAQFELGNSDKVKVRRKSQHKNETVKTYNEMAGLIFLSIAKKQTTILEITMLVYFLSVTFKTILDLNKTEPTGSKESMGADSTDS